MSPVLDKLLATAPILDAVSGVLLAVALLCGKGGCFGTG